MAALKKFNKISNWFQNTVRITSADLMRSIKYDPKIVKGLLSITTLLLLIVSARADAYSDAGNAFSRGDYNKVEEILSAQTSPKAQLKLGWYFTQRGMQNAIKAQYWLEKSAKSGYAEAQEALGYFIICGMNNPISGPCDGSLAEGNIWLRRAFDQYTNRMRAGDCDAPNRLFLFYAVGYVVPKDILRGMEYLRQAAYCGDPHAQNRLGRILMMNPKDQVFPGAPTNPTKGYAWLIIAASKSTENYITRDRQFFEEDLSPSQIRTGQMLARECLESNFKRCQL
jgi:hypothetical protein